MRGYALITVVIPTLNEALHIESVLDDLIKAAPADLVEVLVADGGSTDGTRDVVGRIAQRHPLVRLIDNPERVQAAGINRAVAQADPRSSVIVRMDAHAGYDLSYVTRLAQCLSETAADSVVVRLRTQADGCFQKAVAKVSNSRLGTGGAAHRMGGPSRWIDHGHHAAFKRASFEAIDGYDPSFEANEDAEFDVRLRRWGGKIWFLSSLEVDYYPRESPGRLWRQYYRYGHGRARNLLKHRTKPRIRQVVPPLLVVALTISAVASLITPLSLIIPGAYLLLLATYGMYLTLLGRDSCLLFSSLALLIMHMAWGIGFIRGLAVSTFYETLYPLVLRP